MGRIGGAVLVLWVSMALAGELAAVPDTFTSTTLDAKGFQVNQPYFGAGAKGSVNGFSGNLVLSETDLAIPGRGLDLSVTRRYNSNLWTDATPQDATGKPSDNKYLKPSWVGYGWDLHFGRIKIVPLNQYGNPKCPSTIGENVKMMVEWGDGSSEPIIKVDKTVSPANPTPPNAEYILPDFSRVSWYNVNPAFAWFVITKPDGTKYIFTHHVDLGWYQLDPSDPPSHDCYGGAENPWSDAQATAKKSDQYRYVGIYLTRIEDINGNYISFEYWNSEDLSQYMARIPETGEFGNGCLWHYDLTRGSPFVKHVTDTKGGALDAQKHTLYFEVSNPASINGRLEYIKYKNVKGHEAYLDFVYAGDVFYRPGGQGTLPLQSFGCSPGGEVHPDQCQRDKFLAAVELKEDDPANPGDGLSGPPLFPPTKYLYNSDAHLVEVQTAHDADLGGSTYYGASTKYQYGNVQVDWNNAGCIAAGSEQCQVWRRVVRAVTVCEDPGICNRPDSDFSPPVNPAPALTTFYWYGSTVTLQMSLPQGYRTLAGSLPVTLGISEGPYRGFTGNIDAFPFDDDNRVEPFAATVNQYVSLPPHPPSTGWHNYKDGVLLGTFSYDWARWGIGGGGPIIIGGTVPPLWKEATTHFYKPIYLGNIRYYPLNDDRPHYQLVPKGSLSEKKDDFGGRKYYFTETTDFDKFGNAKRAVDYGEVQDSFIADFEFEAACRGPAGDGTPKFYDWANCRFDGLFTGNSGYPAAGGKDIKGDWNADGIDEDKTITVTQYLHEQNPRYEGRPEPLGQHVRSPQALECTNPPYGTPPGETLPGDLCQELPIPYLGTTFQRITLPTLVKTYKGADPQAGGSEGNKVGETEYRYDTTPLIYNGAVTAVYDDFHHRGIAFVGWPKFSDEGEVQCSQGTCNPVCQPNPCYAPGGAAPYSTPQLETYRGLLTEARTWVAGASGSGSYTVADTYYDAAGRAVLTRTPYFADDMADWEDRGTESWRRTTADETLTLYGPNFWKKFLYCIPGSPMGPSFDPEMCFAAYQVHETPNNNHCSLGGPPPQDLSSLRALYPYPTKTVSKPVPTVLERRPFYAAYPYYGHDCADEYCQEGGYQTPFMPITLPDMDEHLLETQAARVLRPADIKVVRRYDDLTGALLAQWVEGDPAVAGIAPPVPGTDDSGDPADPLDDDDGLYQYSKNLYDALGRIRAVLVREEGRLPGSDVWYPIDADDPIVAIQYFDTQRPRKVVVTKRHCRASDMAGPTPYCLDAVGTLNPTTHLFDGLGRNYASYIQDTDGQYIFTFTEYDHSGNVNRTYRPFKPSAAVPNPDLGAAGVRALMPSGTKYTAVDDRDFKGRVTEQSVMQTGTTVEVVPRSLAKFGIDYTISRVRQDASPARDVWSKTTFDTFGKPLLTISGATNEAQLTSATDGAGGKKRTEFGYDLFGNLANVTVTGYQAQPSAGVPGSVITRSYYTNTGLLVARDSPDAGHMTFSYDGAGRLVQSGRTVGGGDLITWTAYDGMGRPVANSASKHFPSADRVAYQYDSNAQPPGYMGDLLLGVGRVTKFFDGTGTTSFYYDLKGRPFLEERWRSYASGLTKFQYSSNWDGTLRDVQMTSSDPATGTSRTDRLKYFYDALGRLEQIDVTTPEGAYNLIDSILYTPRGSLLRFKQNNNAVTTTYTYEERDVDLLSSVKVEKAATLFWQGFTYDYSGNMLGLKDFLFPQRQAGTDLVGIFGYDTFGRLLSAADVSSGRAYFGADTAFAYDDFGNRRSTTVTPATPSAPVITPVYDTVAYSQPSPPAPTGAIISGSSRLIEDKDFYYDHDRGGNLFAKRLKITDPRRKGDFNPLVSLQPSPWDGWTSMAGAPVTIDAAGSRSGASGDRGLTVKGTSGGLPHVYVGQRFKLEPHVPYTVHGWIKVDSTTTSAYGVLASHCYSYDTLLGPSCGLDDFGTTDFGPQDRRVGPLGAGGLWTFPAGQWHEFSYTVMSTNPAQTHIHVLCYLFPATAGGTVGPEDAIHCDDITVTPDRTSYRYDARNRLAEITIGDQCLKYYYDGLGQRVRVEDSAAQTRTDYAYFQGQVLRKTAAGGVAIACGPQCGNGIVEEGESCDGNVQGATCAEWDPGLVGTPGCVNCQLDYEVGCSLRPACGNGILELGEECEFLDLGCRWEGPNFVCDHCAVLPGDEAPWWSCATTLNRQIYLGAAFHNVEVGRLPASVSHARLQQQSTKGTCFIYRRRYDVGDLEKSNNGLQTCTNERDDPNFCGCEFPNREGRAGCTIKWWDYPSPCRCYEYCGCGPFSSPIFSKCYGSQCDEGWGEDIPPDVYRQMTSCPEGSSYAGSPVFRVKIGSIS